MCDGWERCIFSLDVVDLLGNRRSASEFDFPVRALSFLAVIDRWNGVEVLCSSAIAAGTRSSKYRLIALRSAIAAVFVFFEVLIVVHW